MQYTIVGALGAAAATVVALLAGIAIGVATAPGSTVPASSGSPDASAAARIVSGAGGTAAAGRLAEPLGGPDGTEPIPVAPAPDEGPTVDGPARAEPGDSGAVVTALQERLAALRYDPGPVDGEFGEATTRALRIFQEDAGLEPDGVLTRATDAALDEAGPADVLEPGDEGEAVEALQERLHTLGFDPGPVDGIYGPTTGYAVWALQKLGGRDADGVVGPHERALLDEGLEIEPMVGDGAPTRVEVGLDRQLVVVWRDGEVALVTHASTGSGERFCTPARGCRYAITPTGSYEITWRVNGWRTSELGRLYNPLYFVGGVAIHGFHSVPSYPASKGCVRVPMHIAEYLPDWLPNGTEVHVVREGGGG